MKKLTGFCADAFRGLSALEFRELGDVNLFVGANNTGKTSVLEAIYLYSDMFRSARWIATASLRAEVGAPPLQAVDWLFPKLSRGDHIRLYGTADRWTANRGAGITPLRRVGQSPEQSFSEVHVYGEQEGQLTFRIDSLGLAPDESIPHAYGIPADFLTPISHRNERRQMDVLSRLKKAGRVAELREMLQEFERGVDDVFIDAAQGLPSIAVRMNRFEANGEFPPLYTFGDGFRRAFSYAAALVDSEILLIDEIETAIHTGMLERVFSWLVESAKPRCQIFATTHSLEAADALASAADAHGAEMRVFRLVPLDRGVEVVSVDGQTFRNMRDSFAMDVR